MPPVRQILEKRCLLSMQRVRRSILWRLIVKQRILWWTMDLKFTVEANKVHLQDTWSWKSSSV